MVQVLKGNIVQAPALGELQITEQGYLVLEDGVIRGVYDRLPIVMHLIWPPPSGQY